MCSLESNNRPFNLDQVFMKSVKLEWCLGDMEKGMQLIVDSVKHYGDFPKVNMRTFSNSLITWLNINIFYSIWFSFS